MRVEYRCTRPGDTECFDYHRNYVAFVPDGDILDTLESQRQAAERFIRDIPPDQLNVTHHPYGWSVRTVVEHCCDAERVFGYRALRFAAGDSTPLPGWNENQYADSQYGPAADAESLALEFSALRTSNLCLYKRMTEPAWLQRGNADGRAVSVRTLAWLMAGHWLHHQQILDKRLSATA